jgi:hypothetical protein
MSESGMAGHEEEEENLEPTDTSLTEKLHEGGENMEGKSKDVSIREAQERLPQMETAEEVLSFIEGEERKTVLRPADARLKELGHEGLKLPSKQGETDAVTEEAADFREGVQKEKAHVTCEDVLRKMRAEGKKI